MKKVLEFTEIGRSCSPEVVKYGFIPNLLILKSVRRPQNYMKVTENCSKSNL